MIIIPLHAVERCRKRLGVPNKAVRRMIECAWTRGLPSAERDYVAGHVIKSYAGGRFVFDVRGELPVCVTVLGKDCEQNRAGEIAVQAARERARARKMHIKSRQWRAPRTHARCCL